MLRACIRVLGVQQQWGQTSGSAITAAFSFVLKNWYVVHSCFFTPHPIPPLLLDFAFWAEVIRWDHVSCVIFFFYSLHLWRVRKTNVLKQARSRKAPTCHLLWLHQQNKTTPNSGRKAVSLFNLHFSLHRMPGILFGWKCFQWVAAKKGRNLS